MISVEDKLRAALRLKCAELRLKCAELKQARYACEEATAGPWIWQGDGNDHLESLADSAPVTITAGTLRAMLPGAAASERERLTEL